MYRPRKGEYTVLSVHSSVQWLCGWYNGHFRPSSDVSDLVTVEAGQNVVGARSLCTYRKLHLGQMSRKHQAPVAHAKCDSEIQRVLIIIILHAGCTLYT